MVPSHVTEQIGRVLGGRYRLVAPVGVGPSATVFLADDVRLRRRVAVKVLHPSLADDKDFLRRLRHEVQTASVLRHPHLLTIHDWGDDPTPYLVTEFLDGGSLRDLLDAGHRLSPSQALQVALQAARALDFAHGRGLVHRGLKPSNVLFGSDDRLRIGDFGLARALAAAASTEPEGVLSAAARYASPEQVQGDSVDGRSDVYSLALVVVEGLTGVVPFAADTALATLTARVDAEVPLPVGLGALEGVLRRAAAAQVHDRLDAGELVTALLAAAESLPKPARLPRSVPDVGDPNGGADLADPTLVVLPPVVPDAPAHDDLTYVGIPTGAASSVDVPFPSVDGGSPDLASSGRGTDEAASVELASQELASQEVESSTAPASPESSSGEPDTSDGGDVGQVSSAAVRASRGARGAKIAWIVLGVLLVTSLVGGGVLAFLASRPPRHAIPAVVGAQEAVAVAQLRAMGFKPVVQQRRQDGTVVGQVLATKPAPGVTVAEGTHIEVVVSAGATLVALPADLVGKPLADATSALQGLGLFVGPTQEAWSEDVAAGSVIGLADAASGEVARGQTVILVVSRGPQPRTIPTPAAGTTPDGASDALRSLGLVPATVEVFSDTVPEGQLVGYAPASGGQAPRGSTVQVLVSKGPELVAVPSLSGVRSIDDAVARLEAAGLQAGNAQGRLSGRPRAFEPETGTMVRKGTAVDIILR